MISESKISRTGRSKNPLLDGELGHISEQLEPKTKEPLWMLSTAQDNTAEKWPHSQMRKLRLMEIVSIVRSPMWAYGKPHTACQERSQG